MLAMANVFLAPHVQLRQTQRQETHVVGIRVAHTVNYHVYLGFNYNHLCCAAAQMRQNVTRSHMCLLEMTAISYVEFQKNASFMNCNKQNSFASAMQ